MGLWESVINCKSRKCKQVQIISGDDETSDLLSDCMLSGTMMYHRDFFHFTMPNGKTLFQRIPFIGFSDGNYIYEKEGLISFGNQEVTIKVSVTPQGEKAYIFLSLDKEFNPNYIYRIIECSFF